VKEGAAGALIGNLFVQDLNGDSAFSFGLSDARFAITGSPGAYQLQLISGVALDYEQERSVSLSITATDAGGLSATQVFTISVGNVVGVRALGTSLADTFDPDQPILSRRALTSEADTVDGRAGDDTISAGGGNDVIAGGTGNDTLEGDGGNDVITGGLGADLIDGGAGSDTASYALSNLGVTIDLSLVGIAQSSLGHAEGDVLSGIENLLGSARADWLIGDDFDNVIEGGAGNDILDGGAGVDTVSYARGSAGVVVNLSLTGAQNTFRGGVDTLSGFENVTGSRGSDTLTGDNGDNVLAGGLGYDTLTGGLGADTFHFNSLVEKGDRIVDFVSGVDQLSISAAGFSGAAAGTVNFAAGPAPLPASGTGWFLYDSDDGRLYYDADGAGRGAKALLATFTAGTMLSGDDILVV
jgi:Ca2+-binding RTX toxin-like protein